MIPWLPDPGDLLSIAFDAGGSLASRAATDVLDMIALRLLQGVGWLFAVVWGFIDSSTTPDLYASWFAGGPFAIAMKLASMLLMMAVALAIAEAIWSRDGGELARSVTRHFPKALFMLTTLLFVTTLGLALADAVTTWMLGSVASGAGDFAASLATATNDVTLGSGIVVIVVASVAMLLVLLVVAMELLVRESFIFILVAITAIALVADVYRPTRGAGGRAGRLLAGVIAMKPIIALCFAIGAAALGGSGGADVSNQAIPEPGTVTAAGAEGDADQHTLAIILAGLATVSLAAFTPFTVLRLFPWEGTEATEGTRSAVTGVAKSAVGTGAMVASGAASSAGAAVSRAS